MTKRERRRLSPDGLPVDAREWTEDDWRDLHEAMETVKRKVAKRHERVQQVHRPVPLPGDADDR